MTNPRDDFQSFLEAEKRAPQLSMDDKNRVLKHFARDLVKSRTQMIVFYGVLSIVGYAVSLIACAQNTVGIFTFSHSVAHALHSLPPSVCPIVCGALFTGIPFLFALPFLSRFQLRYLLYNLWWFIGAIPIFMSLTMWILPLHMQHSSSETSAFLSEWQWMGIWFVSAIATPYFLEGLVYLRIRRKFLPA